MSAAAVEAARLVAGVAAHVAPERVERLLGLAQGAAVGDEALGPALRSSAAARSIASSIASGAHDLVGDQPALRAVGGNARLKKIAWRASPLADEAGQPQVRAAGDDALLAGGEVEVRPALGDDAVHDEQPLAGAADGERARPPRSTASPGAPRLAASASPRAGPGTSW